MHRTGRGIWAVKVPATIPGGPSVIMSASCRLCGWSILDAGNQSVVTDFNVAVAAAAAGTLTLTGAQTVIRVKVTPAAAWPAGVNQVTVSNLQGGTATQDIQGGTANPVEFEFDQPIPTTANPVVSVPAIVGGPAYDIDAQATVAAASFPEGIAVAQFRDGGDNIGITAPVTGRTDTQWLSDEGVYVGNRLIFNVVTGLLSGVAYVRDADDEGYSQDGSRS